MLESKDMNRVTKQKLVTLVFFCFFLVYLLAQHRLVGMYYDDFGNASLSYGYDSTMIKGTNYTIVDLMNWSRYIYFNWGGRILYALILIPLLKNGADLFMIIQAIIILGIMYEILVIVKKYNPSINTSIAVFALILGYGSLEGEILRQGMYWASASVLYLWPMLAFFFFILLYYKIEDEIKKKTKIKKSYYVIGLIAIPLVTLSQEQLGGAFLVWFIMHIILIHGKEEKKYLLIDIPYLVFSLITFGLFFAAPGNWSRMATDEVYANLSIVQKIITNFPKMISLMCNSQIHIFNALLICVGMLMIFVLWNKHNKMYLAISFLAIFPWGAVTATDMLYWNISRDIIRGGSFLLFLLDMFFLLIVYCKEKEKMQLIPIMIAAVASVFCLIFSPTFSMRSCIPYVFCCYLLIAYVFATEIIQVIGNTKKLLVYIIVVQTILSLLVAVNVYRIYVGYENNHYIDQYNHNILKSYKNKTEEIYLVEYPNAYYRGVMSCDAGFDYINYWMKEYYDIPQEVKIKWYSIENMLKMQYKRRQALDIQYGEGFYDDEGGSRWAEESAILEINNSGMESKANMKMYLSTASKKEANISIYCNEKEVYHEQINGDSKDIGIKLNLLAGKNVIRFETDAPKAYVDGDERDLVIGLANVSLDLE